MLQKDYIRLHTDAIAIIPDESVGKFEPECLGPANSPL
jgi:hypothetical protein